MYTSHASSLLLFCLYYAIVQAIPGLYQIECKYPIATPRKGREPPRFADCQHLLAGLPGNPLLKESPAWKDPFKIPHGFFSGSCALLMYPIPNLAPGEIHINIPGDSMHWPSIYHSVESVVSTCYGPGLRSPYYLEGETTILSRPEEHRNSLQSRGIPLVGSHSPLVSRAQKKAKKAKKKGNARGAGKPRGKVETDGSEGSVRHTQKIHIKVCHFHELRNLERAAHEHPEWALKFQEDGRDESERPQFATPAEKSGPRGRRRLHSRGLGTDGASGGNIKYADR